MDIKPKVIFVKEQNEMLFQTTLQNIFDDLSENYNLEVQYQHINHKGVNTTATFYTALVIARRK